MDTSWIGDEVVSFRGARVAADALPVFEVMLQGLPECVVTEGPDNLSVLLSAGSGKSAGFPVRDTRRACKEVGVEWGYPDDPRLFRVTLTRDVARLRYGRREVPAIRRHLSRGDYGHDVRLVQDAMARVGAYNGEVSGRFTQEFMRAVREYQGSRGIRVTGQVDRRTWAHLSEESNVYSVA